MKTVLRLICVPLLLLMISCGQSNPKASKEYGPVKLTDFYAAEGKQNRLDELIQKALKDNQKPVLYFGAEWCGPCRRFRASLSDPLMRETLNGATLILIDMDADSEGHLISAGYGIHEIPSFVRVDKDGSVIKKITSAAWDEDVPQEIAPVIKQFLE